MKTFDLTVIITSFHSRDKIFSCIESIEKSIKIIVIENSNDEKLKKEIQSKYQNVECILSKENLGYGAGNNLGLSKVETSYALIINPDVTLNNDAVNKFFLSINNLGDFGIIAPISQNEKYNNFNINEDKEIKEVDICPYPFYSMSINSDGKVSVCFLDWSRKMIIGDANEHSLKEIWDGKKMKSYRKMCSTQGPENSEKKPHNLHQNYVFLN